MDSDQSYPGEATLRWHSLFTPAGPVSFATAGEHLVEIRLGERRGARRPLGILAQLVAAQLREYFAGQRTSFQLPLHLDMPAFTTGVLRAVRRIPFGKTRAYGEIAARVGSPRAARAVGNAVGANPLPLVIPCHRVLAARGALGGFGAGLDWKRYLLELENIAWR
jgi:methylated-DNA-[protein]-cysteine S-methyltransferase